jgi:hypothetical protein
MHDRPYGAVAQLGEHLLCKQGVIGSIPISSTNLVCWSFSSSCCLKLSRNPHPAVVRLSFERASSEACSNAPYGAHRGIAMIWIFDNELHWVNYIQG